MAKGYNEIWKECLHVIKDNVSDQSFKTWFEPIIAVKLQENVLTIQVPSQFFYEWLEEHYIDLLKKTIKKKLGANGRLEYSIVMENNFNNAAKSYTVKLPTSDKGGLKNPPLSMPIDINNGAIKNPFIIDAKRASF